MSVAAAFRKNAIRNPGLASSSHSSHYSSRNSARAPGAVAKKDRNWAAILPLPSPGKVWTAAFVLWAVFVSGIGAGFVGSPGVIQAVRLESLLRGKQARVAEIQSEIASLQRRAEILERSRASQEREIRRVLGYAAPDELIFDFSPDEQL